MMSRKEFEYIQKGPMLICQAKNSPESFAVMIPVKLKLLEQYSDKLIFWDLEKEEKIEVRPPHLKR